MHVGVKISDHAISRWRERINPASKASDDQVIVAINKLLSHAVPVRLRSARGRIDQLLTHGQGAQHLRSGDVLLVVVDKVVTSVYWYDRPRWETL